MDALGRENRMSPRTNPTQEEKMSDAFLVSGSQSFVLGVYCAEHLFLPMSVTRFHHAIELPRRISGEIRVKDAGRFLKEGGV